MTAREKKQLLLKDFCVRLPYGVIYRRNDGANIELRGVDIENGNLNYRDNVVVRECKPYLRSMSSMTEEEENKYNSLNAYEKGIFPHTEEAFDWLLEHHFDYRGLIEKGLALEAPEGMYNKN